MTRTWDDVTPGQLVEETIGEAVHRVVLEGRVPRAVILGDLELWALEEERTRRAMAIGMVVPVYRWAEPDGPVLGGRPRMWMWYRGIGIELRRGDGPPYAVEAAP